jgi:hypothetical protein
VSGGRHAPRCLVATETSQFARNASFDRPGGAAAASETVRPAELITLDPAGKRLACRAPPPRQAVPGTFPLLPSSGRSVWSGATGPLTAAAVAMVSTDTANVLTYTLSTVFVVVVCLGLGFFAVWYRRRRQGSPHHRGGRPCCRDRHSPRRHHDHGDFLVAANSVTRPPKAHRSHHHSHHRDRYRRSRHHQQHHPHRQSPRHHRRGSGF